MDILPTSSKDTVKYGWLSFLEGLYSLSPLQRLLVVGGLVLLIPGFFLVRFVTATAFGFYYENKTAYATTSFTSVSDLQVGTFTLLPVLGGYTAYVEVSNPNFEISASKASYVVTFFDEAGRKVLDKTGVTWIEKSGKRTVVIPRFSVGGNIARAGLKFTDIKWQKKVEIPEVALAAPDPVVFENQGGGMRLEGQVQNLSPYDLGSARVVTFLYNSQKQLVGVSERYEFSLRPGERRAYVLNFPDLKSFDIFRVVTAADTNALDPNNVTANVSGLQLNRDLNNQ